jgi:hypothetical protein
MYIYIFNVLYIYPLRFEMYKVALWKKTVDLQFPHVSPCRLQVAKVPSPATAGSAAEGWPPRLNRPPGRGSERCRRENLHLVVESLGVQVVDMYTQLYIHITIYIYTYLYTHMCV